MVDLDYETARPGGVTLVAVTLDNRIPAPGVDAHRVRLVAELDGPVWPPRTEGVPAAGWNDDGVTVIVPTGRVGSVGFASSAEPVDPPVTIEAMEPADSDAATDPDAVAPEDVVRVLGDPAPPRDAVALPE